MRYALALVLAVTLQSSEPKPYPDGTFCSPRGDLVRGTQTTNHPCACKRHDDVDPSDGEAHKMCKAGEATNPTHDPVCKQFCSESHCACPVSCDTHKH